MASALVATAGIREIRSALSLLVLRTGGWARAVRVLPLAGLMLVFGLWLLIGDEEGVGGFQPVEFGKLTVVIAGALVVVGLERATDPANRGDYGRWLFWTAVLAIVLVIALVLVPIFQSDYSPLLIVLRGGRPSPPVFVPWLKDFGTCGRSGRFVACEDAPVRFVRRPRGLPTGSMVATPIAVSVALLIAVVMGFPNVSAGS